MLAGLRSIGVAVHAIGAAGTVRTNLTLTETRRDHDKKSTSLAQP